MMLLGRRGLSLQAFRQQQIEAGDPVRDQSVCTARPKWISACSLFGISRALFNRFLNLSLKGSCVRIWCLSSCSRVVLFANSVLNISVADVLHRAVPLDSCLPALWARRPDLVAAESCGLNKRDWMARRPGAVRPETSAQIARPRRGVP